MITNDDKLLIARTEDLFSLCDKYCCARFSDFLDGAEQAVISDNLVFPYGYNTLLYGGFDDAEKKILGVFPEWMEPDKAEFPLTCLKIEGGFTRKLTHRDYLGTIMSLGIAPSRLGDIVVSDGFAYVFLHSDIADYVADNVHKIGNQGVKITVLEDLSGIRVERAYKTIGAICASERLDAVTAAAAGVSRSIASGLIEGGKVKVNHREITKTSEPVKEGDLLSIRGHGRFIVYKFGAETRSSRLHVTFKQYI
ncbi:MAG: RNA-binding protein [Candidatus Ornithomonoglobus sp.]